MRRETTFCQITACEITAKLVALLFPQIFPFRIEKRIFERIEKSSFFLQRKVAFWGLWHRYLEIRKNTFREVLQNLIFCNLIFR